MKKLIEHRWKIIFGILAVLYISLGIRLYLAEFEIRSTVLHVCPPEAIQPSQELSIQEPNPELCQPVQTQFDLKQMLFTIFLLPLIIGMITESIAFILPILGLFALDKFWHTKHRTLALIPLACTLSILFLTISLDLPVTIQTPDQFKNVQFGLPLRFIVQDQYYSPNIFPHTTHFSSVLENPTKILWPEFFISFIILFTLIFLALKILILFLMSLRKQRART